MKYTIIEEESNNKTLVKRIKNHENAIFSIESNAKKYQFTSSNEEEVNQKFEQLRKEMFEKVFEKRQINKYIKIKVSCEVEYTYKKKIKKVNHETYIKWFIIKTE